MNVPDNAERYLNKYLSSLREKEVATPLLALEELASDLKKYDDYTRDSDNMILLICSRKFKVHFASKAIKNLSGYSNEEVMNFSKLDMFKPIKLRSLGYPLTSFLWNDSIKSKFSTPPINHKAYTAGMELKHRNGGFSKIFTKQIGLEFDSKNNATAFLIYFRKIDHLMKKNFFWLRITEGENGETKGFFTTQKGKTKYKDAFSEREMQILKFLEKNHHSKEIGEDLGITVNTVEKHRKNMIAKLGAKDSTALVQLCKMCEIL